MEAHIAGHISLVRNLFPVRNNIAAKGKFKPYGKLRIGIKVVAHGKTVEVVAQYLVVLVAEVDLKGGLLVFVKNLKFIPDPERHKRLLAVKHAAGIFSRVFYGVAVNVGNVAYCQTKAD